jgi:hypothetical protein
MEHYIDKLCEALRGLTDKPVTLGRAQEACVYADAICAMERLHGRENGPETFDRETAMQWVEHMENADGTVGPHWTMDQTSAVADASGAGNDIPQWVFGVTMNMMYSDYYDVARKFGVNVPEFYAELARAFLMDKDGPGPEEKLCAYYRCIVKQKR